MRSLARLAIAALCATGLLAMTSCAVPTGPTTVAYAGKSGTGGLTFTFNQLSGARGTTAVSGVGYLTVVIHSDQQRMTLFQSATMSGPTATVSFTNLIPGSWYVDARLYDSATTGNLLYFGSTTATVFAGSTNNATIPVYQTGLFDVTIQGGIYADAVSLVDKAGLSTGSTIEVEGSDQLVAFLTAAEGACDQQVNWSSSDSAIADVDKTGNVRGVSAGTATITATALYNKNASASFTVNVVEAGYVGTWLITNSGAARTVASSTQILTMSASSFTSYYWYGPSGNASQGTIDRPAPGTIAVTTDSELSAFDGSYQPIASPPTTQMTYSLSLDGTTLTLVEGAMVMTGTRLAGITPMASIPQTGISTGSTLYYSTSTAYPLNTTFNPAATPTTSAPDIPAYCYAILDSAGTTDLTSSGLNFYVTGDILYYTSPPSTNLFVSYIIRRRSISDPTVVDDFTFTVGS